MRLKLDQRFFRCSGTSIRLHFDYCSEVRDTVGTGLSNRLQKLQNRAARVVLSISNDTLDSGNRKRLDESGQKVHMQKMLNDLATSSLADLFVQKSDITEYDLPE